MPSPFPRFTSVGASVFGNLTVLVAVDEAGDVWQYTKAGPLAAGQSNPVMVSQEFVTDGIWLRLGTSRMIQES